MKQRGDLTWLRELSKIKSTKSGQISGRVELRTHVVAILIGEPYRRYIRKVCVGGIDKCQINLDQVEDFPIITPPKAIQKSLIELQTLFDSLMQEYFG